MKRHPSRIRAQMLGDHLRERLNIRSILSIIVVIIIFRQFWLSNYENVFIGLLTLVLFAVPGFLGDRLGLDLPPLLRNIVFCFIFAAEILGEISSFFTKVPFWDAMLHTTTGFLMAAVGLSLVDLLSRDETIAFHLSPFFLSIVAFCFSMTIGVLWEFFEFFADWLLHIDMQKDTIVHTINSVALDPDGLNIVHHVKIDSVIVNGEDWTATLGGYLDIGLIDTMKDLFVNFIGAIVFSVIGFFYVKNRGKGKLANSLIPKVRRKEHAADQVRPMAPAEASCCDTKENGKECVSHENETARHPADHN